MVKHPEGKGHSRALVIHSGGQDSTTCLAWALTSFNEVHTLSINYGQRHARELEAASKTQDLLGIPDKNRTVIDVGAVLLSSSPLVDRAKDVEHYSTPEDMPGGVEPTFVPARNILFLTLAANVAASKNIFNLVTGVCQEDFGGYPDCRQKFIDRMAQALGEGIYADESKVLIHTPLMNKNKKQTAEMSKAFPGLYEALAYSHTCYDGEYPPNPHNHASMIRARGFHQAQLADPLILRAKEEGQLPNDYPDSGYVVGTRYQQEHPPAPLAQMNMDEDEDDYDDEGGNEGV